jgi:hypothetical protein
MEILELIVILITIAGLFIWNRTESRADIRHLDAKIDAIRELTHAIHAEVKDFHSRLCAIEERRDKHDNK